MLPSLFVFSGRHMREFRNDSASPKVSSEIGTPESLPAASAILLNLFLTLILERVARLRFTHSWLDNALNSAVWYQSKLLGFSIDKDLSHCQFSECNESLGVESFYNFNQRRLSVLLVTILLGVSLILACRPLIGPDGSRDLSAGLWLAEPGQMMTCEGNQQCAPHPPDQSPGWGRKGCWCHYPRHIKGADTFYCRRFQLINHHLGWREGFGKTVSPLLGWLGWSFPR